MQLKGRKGLQVSHLENGLGEKGKAAQILAGGERGAGGLDW
jgi:nitrite reductase (NAD(P)H)